MMMTHIFKLLVLSGCVLLADAAHADVVNLDLQQPGDTTYNNDDGIFSSLGGDIWNGIDPTTNIVLRDEFGSSSGWSIVQTGNAVAQSSSLGPVNTLQDSGFVSSGNNGFLVTGFSPGDIVDLAVYMDPNVAILITHSLGDVFVNNSGGPPHSGVMPGVDGADYVIVEALKPADLGGGQFGFQFGTEGVQDGLVAGIQIRTSIIPEPATTTWIVLAGLFVARLNVRHR